MTYTTYTRVDWPEVQDLMNEDWFYNEAILDNRQGESAYLIPIELVDNHSIKPKNAVIIYSIPEILLDSQIQPAIDMLNTLGVKAYVVNKDSFFKRDLRVEIKDRITKDDIFCLGIIFGRNIKL
jgi:hypothetical protein